jgi:hypothetical protein
MRHLPIRILKDNRVLSLVNPGAEYRPLVFGRSAWGGKGVSSRGGGGLVQTLLVTVS